MENSLTRQQEIEWLRIALAEIPPVTMRQLLSAYSYDTNALFADTKETWAMMSPSLLARQASRLFLLNEERLDAAWDTLKKLDMVIVPITSSIYPSNLKPLDDAPPMLFIRGEIVPDDRFSVAMVGSRRATAYGLSIANRFAKELAERGLCIVSGGARGVDTYAHRGAVEAHGRTLVILGCGLDYCYPPENRGLFDKILDEGRGAIISEFAPGVTPEPWRFPARNRLLSGLSMGSLVIESPVDSGAMITASEAARQGREVFATPGPIDTGRSAGCHKLIQEGAKLVETPQDIMDALGLFSFAEEEASESKRASGYQPAPSDLSSEQRIVLNMLSLEPKLVDSIILETTLSSPQVSGILTLLEIRGLVRRIPGNSFVRAL